jgi:hypothetical protein
MYLSHEPVHDRIGHSGLLYILIPLTDGQLRSDDSSPCAIAVLKYLQQTEPHQVVQGLEPKVIQDKQWRTRQRVELLDVGTVQTGRCQRLDKAVHGIVDTAVAQHAGPAAQGTGQVAFATARGTGNEDILPPVYKTSVREQQQLLFGQPPLYRAVNLLCLCVVTQLGEAQVELGALMLAVLCLGLGHHGHQQVWFGLLVDGKLDSGLVAFCHALQLELL